MQGFGICIIYKNNEGYVDHLFVNCPFTREVWREIIDTSGKNRWEKRSLINCFHLWIVRKVVKSHMALPCLVIGGVWVSKKK
jgi:hypothetical protein